MTARVVMEISIETWKCFVPVDVLTDRVPLVNRVGNPEVSMDDPSPMAVGEGGGNLMTTRAVMTSVKGPLRTSS